MSATITKHISFPAPLFASIEKKAGNFGVSIAEYLRHLAINDITATKKENLKLWEESLPVYKGLDVFWGNVDESKAEGFSDISFDEFKKR